MDNVQQLTPGPPHHSITTAIFLAFMLTCSLGPWRAVAIPASGVTLPLTCKTLCSLFPIPASGHPLNFHQSTNENSKTRMKNLCCLVLESQLVLSQKCIKWIPDEQVREENPK
ncbi:hypothetical protein DdX_07941 [Ditylenchus destructor]|uniref:Uncharacterized protein n=1 Tax=Ditylenchus destructor TaxID=166010 RepID=A0AAD4N3G9_9BILA|nr:hypothetical protein DdX_07941 [Ditylenchus destructor]